MCPRVLPTIIFSTIGYYNSELFWVEQQIFCAKRADSCILLLVTRDGYLRALCVPVRAGPESEPLQPTTVAGQTASLPFPDEV